MTSPHLSAALLTTANESLAPVLPILNAFAHRHRNQHHSSHWWSSFFSRPSRCAQSLDRPHISPPADQEQEQAWKCRGRQPSSSGARKVDDSPCSPPAHTCRSILSYPQAQPYAMRLVAVISLCAFHVTNCPFLQQRLLPARRRQPTCSPRPSPPLYTRSHQQYPLRPCARRSKHNTCSFNLSKANYYRPNPLL
ncbi:RNase MRP subunit [Fusarium falciforme]